MPARRQRAAEATGVVADELRVLSSGAGLSDDQADHMVENAVGVMGLPLGLCVNMSVEGRDYVVPMAVEEASVVAACSHASKLIRAGGGVRAEVGAPHMIGQIQILDVPDVHAARAALLAAKAEILGAANATNKVLCDFGGGAFDLEVRELGASDASDPLGPMLVVHLLVDVRDAMGANAINTMCETLAPRVAELTGGRVGLRILSNLADRRLVTVTGRVPVAALEGKGCDSGLTLAKRIEEASVFAERDPYRASTHNKGIMNGVDAVLIALGQDWRAIEAGAHAYAARGGRYTALSTWRVETHADGTFLVGRMTMPMAVGTVGGVISVHPVVKANRKIVGVQSAGELAAVICAAGLAQNLGALRALSAEGIQSGHMRLHARNIAIQAGAVNEEIQIVANRIADARRVNLEAAEQALASLRAGSAAAAHVPPRAPDGADAVREDAPAEDAEDASGPPSGVAPRSAAACAEDLGVCDRLLPGVSRTFALSIQNLPADLRRAVCVAYLLCRVVDTVEDDRRVPPAVRQSLFDAFDAALRGAAAADASGAADFERRSVAAGLGPTPLEAELCSGAGAVFRVFSALPEVQRQAIEPRVLEMSRGMRAYSVRADEEGGLRLRDVADLEKYCYYVAGTVGELLTDLFAIACPMDPKARREVDARAVSFGLGLQFVNILKDVADDAVRGDCFLPVGAAAEHGLDLARVLEPQERAKGVALLRALSARAREHLTRAEEYTVAWPMSEAGGQIRLFCAVPLALALGTLREVELGGDALVPGRAPTVSRAFVMAVFEAAVAAAGAPSRQEGDAALRALLDRARAGVAGRPQRPTATLPSVVPPSAAVTRGARSSTHPPLEQGSTMSEKQKAFELQPRRELGGKILVTGAAGHVGANLVHRLLSEGHEVRVLLRSHEHDHVMDALERATGKKLDRAYADLRSAKEVLAGVRGADHVFHVAARVSTLSGTEKDLRDLYACNVLGTAHVLRAAGECGVKRTVVTGSLSAVGYDLDDPSKASDESQPFYPFTEHLPYGRTKSLVEHEVLKACVDGVDALVATSCAVLGPWDFKPSRMGRTLLDFAHGRLRGYPPGGFDFVNVRDLVDGHVRAMERGRTGQRYILSTSYATVDELMDVFEEATGRPRPRFRVPVPLMKTMAHVSTFVLSNFFPNVQQRFTPAAVRLLNMQRKADTSKAQRELGFSPTDIRTAIHEAYAHFAERGLVPQSPSLTASGASEAPKPKPAGKGRQGAAA